METDILVIGGGFAGLTAAARAAELGLKALVLEQGSLPDYLCNSRISGGHLHICRDNPVADVEYLKAKIQTVTDNFADPKLASLFAGEFRTAIEWLRSIGIRFMRVGLDPQRQFVMVPLPLGQPGLHWKGRGPDAAMRQLSEHLVKNGGQILLNHCVTRLIMSEGKCVGADVVVNGETLNYLANAVVIADGGFQANPELVGRFISRHPNKLMQRNAGTGLGYGIRMAEEAGARLVGTENFYGHLLSQDAFTNELLWPYPYLDILAVSGIVVGKNGKRFVDEGRGAVHIANVVARLEDPLDAFVIFDDAIWNGPAADISVPPAPNPTLINSGATLYSAATISELAAKANISAKELEQSVISYNASFENSSQMQLKPPRTSGRQKGFPILKPPFHAMPLCAGISYTMGGLAIDTNSRVIREDGHPIQGLYAAGASTGGLEGGIHSGYVGGLAKAFFCGFEAANSIAIEKKESAKSELL